MSRNVLLFAPALVACHRAEPAPSPTAATTHPTPPTPAAKMIAPAVEEEPSPPPYDIGADRENRARIAREELGPKTMTAFVAEMFVVIGPPGSRASFDASVAL